MSQSFLKTMTPRNPDAPKFRVAFDGVIQAGVFVIVEADMSDGDWMYIWSISGARTIEVRSDLSSPLALPDYDSPLVMIPRLGLHYEIENQTSGAKTYIVVFADKYAISASG